MYLLQKFIYSPIYSLENKIQTKTSQELLLF